MSEKWKKTQKYFMDFSGRHRTFVFFSFSRIFSQNLIILPLFISFWGMYAPLLSRNSESWNFDFLSRCQGQKLEDCQGLVVLGHFCPNGQINGHIFLRNDAWFEFTVRYIQIRHFTLSGGLNRYKKFYIKINRVYSTQVDRS